MNVELFYYTNKGGMHKITSIDDTDEYMILVNVADAEASFSQLISDFHHKYPSLEIHEIYKVATEKLERLLIEELLGVVKIKYQCWDDVARTEHLFLSDSLLLINKPGTWDRESDEVYRLCATDSGLNLLDTSDQIYGMKGESK
ncbi:hypothetical protein MUG84_22455 [Paenibacillus sp. KQZ6P-2]|uniref:Uncharacterized protein n=1 Tax=Paenibacillus mangrovi TaxID=2931978 RepID=A0A9X1WTT6_9BACL|nr:hypothetical protein [Paenibacillus mangrovi]MCJ8014466.1 hypothetical protein [Paenibacillus mangrovi]